MKYTPEQNGVSERMNRTLMEKARSMTYDSSLPKTLWGEAILTATYIINRCPTKALKDVQKTPIEVWSGKKPSVKNMIIFGSRHSGRLAEIKGFVEVFFLWFSVIGFC